VVQQRQGRVVPTMQMQGVSINDDHGLEAEADAMGVRASQLKRAAQLSRHRRARAVHPGAQACERSVVATGFSPRNAERPVGDPHDYSGNECERADEAPCRLLYRSDA
jgi:hypothetical protein